jgi:glycosyltransferase involved in cell wall biosynthesis
MKVAALTSGINTPSARFRVRQYIPVLKSLDVDVTDYCPAISNGARLPGPLRQIRRRYLPPVLLGQALLNVTLRTGGVLGSYRADVTWLERNFAPGLDDLARVLKGPLVVDIDDAIWLYNPFGESVIKRLVARADMVFAGNNFLADWCSQYCSNVQVVATAIDADRFRPAAKSAPSDGRFVIGWTGTSGNFRFLRDIQPALATFLGENPDTTFRVIADEHPVLPMLPLDQLEFIPWTPAAEHEVLTKMDVGIMPIDDTDLSRGKCSFKMLQYMATGLPVVVSPYGMNADVLQMGNVGFGVKTNDEWLQAFRILRDDAALRTQMGQAGRSVIEAGFSTVSIATKIAASFGRLRV